MGRNRKTFEFSGQTVRQTSRCIPLQLSLRSYFARSISFMTCWLTGIRRTRAQHRDSTRLQFAKDVIHAGSVLLPQEIESRQISCVLSRFVRWQPGLAPSRPESPDSYLRRGLPPHRVSTSAAVDPVPRQEPNKQDTGRRNKQAVEEWPSSMFSSNLSEAQLPSP